MLLALLLSCTADPAPTTTAPDAVGAEAPQPDHAGADAAARRQPEEGWGAVMWADDTWYSTGGGSLAAGPKAAIELQPTGSTGLCGSVIGDPQGAMIVLPQGAPTPELIAAPAIQAAMVERAAWRLDELLPDADRFSPAPTSPDPSRARGVTVGSVAKTRRHGAPPVLVAAGHRDCTGIIAVLTADASQALTHDTLTDSCEPLRVLPPTDLDGDGKREVAAWSRSRAALYRLDETPGDVALVRLADWTCK